MRRPLGVLLAAGLAAGLAPAAPTPAAPTVESLVARLGDDSFAEREAASKELLARGPAVLEALARAADGHPDPEVRQRAAALVEQLKRSGDTIKLLAPKTVKLDYTAVPLGTALADLKAKTGIPLALDQHGVANPLRPVTAKTGELPAWEAVEAFCRAAGLKEVFRETLGTNNPADPFGRGGRRPMGYAVPGQAPTETAGQVPVLLADGKTTALPGDRSTAVRVLALPAEFPGNRVVRGSGTVVLNLDVTPLPGVKWDEVTTVRVLRAEDETGRPLTASHRPEPHGPAYGPYEEMLLMGGMPGQVVFWGGDVAYQVGGNGVRHNPRVVPVTLRTDDRAVRSLRAFEGVVVGEVIQPDQPLAVIADMGRSVGVPAFGPNESRFTVLDYKELPGGKVSVKVRSEGPNPWQLQRLGRRGGLVANSVAPWGGPAGNGTHFRFTDAAGKTFPQPQTLGVRQSDDGFRQTSEVDLVFVKRDGYGPPVTLTVTGNKPATVEVPFRMKNVPLP